MKLEIPPKPDLSLESSLIENGFENICGIDEAGRGSWAGPIVSAAVILGRDFDVVGINDSKKIKPQKREELAREIKGKVVSFAVGIASTQEINTNGIQKATYLSYLRAINGLSVKVDYVLIDHYEIPDFYLPQRGITKGDQISQSIAAASILAKVTRDEIMKKQSLLYKIDYGFDHNFGYGTAKHQEAILRSGLCPIHRTLFVRNLLSTQREFKLNRFDASVKLA